MIKIVQATPPPDNRISLVFSDGSFGELDLQPLIDRNTELTEPLADAAFRNRFFLELGALCWPNGLELSAASLHQRLRSTGHLRTVEAA
ncbi:DUF2442 domain-containing protein [Sinimarinibacterium thermocellulolyticum]|uniref:DUF2442 domain-containing protein n=1 Tax=Sinimarinibacterium thermocellulolyticum TaxID=3170016 RepID=A0ABV2A647_9GAMM